MIQVLPHSFERAGFVDPTTITAKNTRSNHLSFAHSRELLILTPFPARGHSKCEIDLCPMEFRAKALLHSLLRSMMKMDYSQSISDVPGWFHKSEGSSIRSLQTRLLESTKIRRSRKTNASVCVIAFNHTIRYPNERAYSYHHVLELKERNGIPLSKFFHLGVSSK
jgi:hypothetical protein